MSHPDRPHQEVPAVMRVLSAATAILALVVVGAGTPGRANASQLETSTLATRPYLVVLRQAPTASYQGDIAGYRATAPQAGQRFDDTRVAVASYRSYLLRGQAEILAGVDYPEVLYAYTTALDGFAAMLTSAQAKVLQTTAGVLSVQLDALVKVDDAEVNPAVDLAEAPPLGLWRQVGGASHAGRGLVVGVIDTGVTPENPSLAGIPLSRSTLEHRYPGFTGICQPGARWTESTCSSKVIAARYFDRGFGSSHVAVADYLSPRDGSGHGTSVAAIAAGNSGVDTQIAGQDFGHISGMAPAAGVSVYKACWSAPDPSGDGCDLADAVAAIDQAVRDGVDVINYSIGGTQSDLGDAVELAFLNAAAANVFVATAAGNTGPEPGTVQHPSPWVTTVGANTHDVFQGAIRLGNGSTYVGAMLSDQNVGPAPLVYAGDVPAAGVTSRRAALCYPGSLDAQRVDQSIVVCDRGVSSRVSKSAAVAQSGGSGMVLVNATRDSVDADLHDVPTVHLDAAAGRQVKAYLAQAGASASATMLAQATDNPPVPVVAPFSGRGPTAAADGDLLKPDLTAPGVSVISAVAPGASAGQLWDVESGTSIATPHVAGIAAVVMGANPSWTPAMVKSALMTTAGPLVGTTGPLVRGAGELDTRSVLEPGLVYASGFAGWQELLRSEGIKMGSAPVMTSVDASELNQASIAIGDLVGRETATRTVTNVGSRTSTYTATVVSPRGVATSVAPASLTLAPGRSASFTVTFSATRNARYDEFAGGSLTWHDTLGHAVTSPIAIRPELAATPRELTGAGRHGTATVRALAGVTGTIQTTTTGLVGATPVQLDLHPHAFDPAAPATSAGTAVETLAVPLGARAVRFQVSSSHPGDDLDLYVYRDAVLVSSATSRSADEVITMTAPEAGTYRLFVNAPGAADGLTTSATVTSWVIPESDQGNLTLTPANLGVDGGERFSVTTAWSGLSSTRRWWGYIAYQGLPSVTYLTVN